ncbi:myelin-associated glycoprotein-like isoform X5 [Xyrichtys novacula]|uniref:Myelin-associated glycoprotein-like isoform X5 n=1 Tax=Xyrichtys novacula TaxID=13765 RepID=A0AAV1FMZ5_XYRNO|nr:myelin-associated glycoprotein-like isoform X5 [Xyrichtys novacula]
MAAALPLLLIGCLLQGAICQEFKAFLPKTIEVLKGSCVTIPCSFDIETRFKSNLDSTCIAKWNQGSYDGPFVFHSSDPQQSSIGGKLTGVLTRKDCSTTLNNMQPQHSNEYFFRVECNNGLRYNFRDGTRILVKERPPRPTLTPSTLEVKEGTAVRLTCSAPAPCLSLPPTLTWTPSLGEVQETERENLDKTKVKMSVVNFYASHLQHRQKISCTAVYRKQDGSTESSVDSLTAEITYSPQRTTVSVSPSGPVKEHTTVTLTCTSNANPTVKDYTWYRADRGQGASIGTGQTLNINASPDTDPIFCKAENKLGTGQSRNTQIDVQYSPKGTTVSVSPSGPVKEHTTVTLTCTSNANPAVKDYTWYRADGGQGASIGTGQTLNINASPDTDPIFCKAENEVGVGRSSNTQIDVQYSPKETTVVVSPSGPVKEGSNVTLACSSRASPAVQNYNWYRVDGSQEITIGTGQVIDFTASRESVSLFCTAQNDLGAGRSNVSHVDVQFAPQILPSSDCNKTVDQVKCSCKTSGNPPPTLHWYLDELPVNTSGQSEIRYVPENGTNVSLITVSQAQWRDHTLLCRSSNSLGSATLQFYFLHVPKTTTESQDLVVVLILVATVVALIVLVCALLFVIRAQKSHQNLLKSQCPSNTSTVAMNQLQPSGEENEVPTTKDEDIYANTTELEKDDVAQPATTSEPNSTSLPSSDQNNTSGAGNSSEETTVESKDAIYSNVTWKRKSKIRKEGDGTNLLDSSYPQEEMSVERGLTGDFVNNAVEMGNLYGQVKPRNVRKESECEYAQVKFRHSAVQK